MSLPTNALVTITEAQEYARATTADLPALERYVAAASDWFEQETRRKLKSQSITGYFHGDGTRWLMLYEWPVTAFTSVEFRTGEGTWTAQDTTYLLISDQLRLYAPSWLFPVGEMNVRVVYTAGYATVPEDLKQACLELMLDKWRMADRQVQGVQTINYEGQTVTITPEAVPRSVRQVADRYKRLVL